MEAGSSTTFYPSRLQQLPGDYLLVAFADQYVSNKIQFEKQQFSNNYGQKADVNSGAYITIGSFKAYEAMEETMIRWMQRICSANNSFSVSLNNYSGFPPHTIYLRIQNPAPFRQLTKELQVIDNYIRNNGCPPARFFATPHICIAQQVAETVCLKALADYSQKTFHETFAVSELVLLKVTPQGQQKCINVFHLKPGNSIIYN